MQKSSSRAPKDDLDSDVDTELGKDVPQDLGGDDTDDDTVVVLVPPTEEELMADEVDERKAIDRMAEEMLADRDLSGLESEEEE